MGRLYIVVVCIPIVLWHCIVKHDASISWQTHLYFVKAIARTRAFQHARAMFHLVPYAKGSLADDQRCLSKHIITNKTHDVGNDVVETQQGLRDRTRFPSPLTG